MKVKEESEKVGLKLNIQKMTIMASGPIASRQIDGETVENCRRGNDDCGCRCPYHISLPDCVTSL